MARKNSLGAFNSFSPIFSPIYGEKIFLHHILFFSPPLFDCHNKRLKDFCVFQPFIEIISLFNRCFICNKHFVAHLYGFVAHTVKFQYGVLRFALGYGAQVDRDDRECLSTARSDPKARASLVRGRRFRPRFAVGMFANIPKYVKILP